MTRSLDPKKIKSAQRVLEVLEYFNAGRREGTVMDIARTYGYPQSSTSELLSCLVALGYLRRDLSARTYRPSARVAMLGAWVQPDLFRHGAALTLMDELAADMSATVMLTSRVGLGAQVFQVVEPDGDGGSEHKIGDTLLLMHSAPGKALLSSMRSTDLKKLVHRMNAESPEALRVRFEDLNAELDGVRAKGFSISRHDSGVAMVSVLLPRNAEDEPLALTLCTRVDRLDANIEHFVQALRGAVSRHIGIVEVKAPTAAPLVKIRAV
jgi:DNA-binding IclR family transcriptional regulator